MRPAPDTPIRPGCQRPLRRQLRIHLQARLDNPLERVQLVLDRRPPRIATRARLQLPVQLTGLDPVVDRSPAELEPSRQLGFRHPLLEVMLQQHLRLHVVHLSAPPYGLTHMVEQRSTRR